MGRIYKILTVSQWANFARTERFTGSEHDQRDGFIHMCSGPQLSGTLEKHYRAASEVFLVGFDATQFGTELKWEISRGGDKFPHLFQDLHFSALVNVHKLSQTPAGGFVLPKAL